MALLHLKYGYNKFLAKCDGWLKPGLTLLTYSHAEAAATYPLLFLQQLLQKA